VKYLPKNVTSGPHPTLGYGYIVTNPDGSREVYRLAWQATARAHGWAPPTHELTHARSLAAVAQREG
jgi:hypothetical protein